MTLTTGTEQLEAAVEIETSRVLHQWVWYAGTYQQYTTAFLLLVYLFAHPMRKEAGRIWRILDYVFEVPEDLSRDQKARLILTEIRDRTGIYRDARKLRAPISMLHHMASLPIQPRSPNGSEDMTSQPAPTTSSLYQDYQNFSMLNNENHPGLQSGPASLTGISDNTSSTSPSALPPLNTSDDLMADIDWVSFLSYSLTHPLWPCAHRHARTNGTDFFLLISALANRTTDLLLERAISSPYHYLFYSNLFGNSFTPYTL